MTEKSFPRLTRTDCYQLSSIFTGLLRILPPRLPPSLKNIRNEICKKHVSTKRQNRNYYNIIGPSISSRRFFKDGSSSTTCMKFRMVTHMLRSTVSNLKFQCMTVHFSVNKVIFISSENVYFCAKLSVFAGNFMALFYSKQICSRIT